MEGMKALVKGLATTLKVLFKKPVTEQYPEYKRPLPSRSRARDRPDARSRTARSGAWPAISARPSARPAASPCSRRRERMAAGTPGGSESTLPAASTAGSAKRRVPLLPFS